MPSLYLKQSGLLDQMRREILCDGVSLVEADSTSASIRGNPIITSSIDLMTQLYTQVDSSTSHTHTHTGLVCCSLIASVGVWDRSQLAADFGFILCVCLFCLFVPVDHLCLPCLRFPAYSYSFKGMTDALALDRIAVGEIDFASE